MASRKTTCEVKSVGIIGGGPAGLLCAAYIAATGASVRVFERYSPTDSAETDQTRPCWNIGLSPVSKRAIEGAGLKSDFRAEFKSEGMTMHTAGNPPTFIGPWDPYDKIDALALLTQPAIVKHFAEECARVYGGLITVERGMRLVAGNICDGQVTLESSKGEQQTLEFDLIVGADGTRSTARSLMQQQDPSMEVDSHDSELTLLACNLTPQGPPEGYASLPTPSGVPYQGKPTSHTAPVTGRSMGFIMADPAAQAGTDSVSISVGGGGAVVSATIACTPEWFAQHGPGTEAETRGALLAAFAHMPTVWVEEVAAAVCQREELGLTLRPLRFITCSKLASGRAVIIGDAAHAMSPNLGMGCNSALCDAQVLGGCVAASRGDAAAAAAAYNTKRLRDVQGLTRLSRKLNEAVNYPYHGSFWKLLWGAPVLLSLLSRWSLKSSKGPARLLKPRENFLRLLHEDGDVRGAERSTALYFYRTVATVAAVVGLAAFGGFQGVSAIAAAGTRALSACRRG
eukprot:jgi/Ulvmu1/5795/UM025_0049.1